jgi:monoamine oxidase
MAKTSSSTQPQYDVVIVGGGISGVYSGWRLMTADVKQSPILKKWAGKDKLKVAVFEGSGRIGGRLLTARPQGFPDTVCELGGMRYVSSQTLIRSLVENELKLKRFEQVVAKPENIAYIRGKQIREGDLTSPGLLPYDLTWAEQENVLKEDPSGLLGWAVAKLLPGVNQFTGADLEKYLQYAKIDGVPLYKIGFWNLIAKALSPEAYQLSRTLVGYDCLGSNVNAVDLSTEYFEFTPGVHYYLFNQGYDTVPWELEQRFKSAGGEVIQDSWVEGFDKITLDDGTVGVKVNFRDHKKASVIARAIILAVPRRSLELLKPEGPVLDPEKSPAFQNMLHSVEPIPLYKIFLAYPYPWWTAVGVSQGRSLTDLPIRQCYYWPVVPGDNVTPSPYGHALTMSYNDASSVDFWAGLAQPRRKRDPKLGLIQRNPADQHEAFLSKPLPQTAAAKDPYSQRLRENWDKHKATAAMVEEMHRQLVQMHNVALAPEPVDAAFIDWSADPYGGGVHLWKRGYKSWEMLEDITQPVDDFPCYICGEAYSTNQTWAEGSLQTAEIVLQKRLLLDAPAWITANPKN